MSNDSPIIFGAGLAGLMAARMLADRMPQVYERQASLPNNHAALLRFRDDEVSQVTNIPFLKVKVLKGIHGSEGPISDAVRYSYKVTGGYFNRSITDTTPVDRFVAPDDFISRLAQTADITFGLDFEEWTNNLLANKRPIISTMPVPYMMDLFKWEDKPDFQYGSGWTLTAEICDTVDVNLNITMYFPGDEAFYRASVTGRRIMIEGTYAQEGIDPANLSGTYVLRACEAMGINPKHVHKIKHREAKYQKISDLNDAGKESVKRFIMHLTDKHKIHSLGRFATWRPKLLLDDIPQDVRVIARLFDGKLNYNQRTET